MGSVEAERKIEPEDERKKAKAALLYILDCPWCVKTKRLIRESLKELRVKAKVEEILIDSDEKAKKL